MNVIPYANNAYSGNIAIVIDKDSTDNLLLIGDKQIQVTDDAFNEYVYAAQTSMYDRIDINAPAYDIFTVDLFGYKDLYMQVQGKLHAVFANWRQLLSKLLEQPMDDSITNDICKYNVLSLTNGVFMHVYLLKSVRHDVMFRQNHLMSARLLNIAIPKSYNVRMFYTKANTLTKYDKASSHLSLLHVQHEQHTYNMSDFKPVYVPSGQSATFRLSDDLRVSIVCEDVNHMYSRTICVQATLEDLYKYEAYFDIIVQGNTVTLRFMYNPNRTYKVVANTAVTMQPVITTSMISIIGNDMLRHAESAGLTVNGQYMHATTKLVTLPAVHKSILVDALPIMEIRNAPYDYGIYKTSADNQWTGYDYMYTPVQTNDTRYNRANFANITPLYPYGNLHTFLLDSSLANSKVPAYYKLHTATALSDNDLDKSLSKCNLPTVHNGQVAFRNILYMLLQNGKRTSDFDGKKFAVVLHPMTDDEYAKHDIDLHEPKVCIIDVKLIWSANYVCIVCHATMRQWLSALGKTNYTDVAIKDFYDSQILDLLPTNLAQSIMKLKHGNYSAYVSASMQDIPLTPPCM